MEKNKQEEAMKQNWVWWETAVHKNLNTSHFPAKFRSILREYNYGFMSYQKKYITMWNLARKSNSSVLIKIRYLSEFDYIITF